MDKLFTRIASVVAGLAGQPSTFLLALGTIAVWGLSGPVCGFSDTWQLVINTGTTVLTFLAVFLIQNSQNRDGAAIQAKLDEILRSVADARSGFVGIEHLTDEEIARVFAPCGLDIGSSTVEETAVAILAEIIAQRTGRGGRPLREVEGPIRRQSEKPSALAR